MEFPNQPTVLPAAQRHTEKYVAEQGRAFQGGDVVTVHIPPTDKTYLTKNAKLHFDFDMEYREGTNEDYQNLFKLSPPYVIDNPTEFQNAFMSRKMGTITIPNSGWNWKYEITIGTTPLAVPVTSFAPGTYTVGSMLTALEAALRTAGTAADNVHWIFQDGKFQVVSTIPGVYVQLRTGSNLGPYLGVDRDTEFGQTSSAQSPPLYDGSYNESIYIPGDTQLYIAMDIPINGAPTPNKLNVYLPPPPTGSSGQTILMDDLLTYMNAQCQADGYQMTWSFDRLSNVMSVTRATGLKEIKISDRSQEGPTVLGFTTIPSKNAQGNAGYRETIVADTHPHSISLARNFSFDGYRSYPALDTNGAYGFIRDIEVYDYMGSTVLEKVPRHDLLTSIFMDFEGANDQMQVPRPYGAENNNLVIRKQPWSSLFEDPAWPFERDAPIYYNWSFTDPGKLDSTYPVLAESIKIPKMHFVIDLYSFMGKLSQKFIPLHNGFTLKLHLNKTSDVVAFNTQLPSNVITMKFPTSSAGTAFEEVTQTMHPSIVASSFTNVYLKCDLITVSAEMDSKIEKTVFAKAFKYSLDTLTSRTTRIPLEVASLTSVLISQRPNLGVNSWSQKFGFRVKNYIQGAQLLFNKAVVKDIASPYEAYEALKDAFDQRLDWWINREDWNVDIVDQANYTCGMQGNIISDRDLDSMDADPGSYFVKTFQYGDEHGVSHQGKFLLALDTRLPGYQESAVCGIDTRKELLEYRLIAGPESRSDVLIDVFAQFDTFIVIKPGETTSVAF
jgi:hypothetical protein